MVVLLKLLEGKQDLLQDLATDLVQGAAASLVQDKVAIERARQEEETFNLLCCIRSLATNPVGWGALAQQQALASLLPTGGNA